MLREGFAADLVLFDPARIKDTATFAEPIAAAEGIACVIVNGAVSYRPQEGVVGRAGRLLRGRRLNREVFPQSTGYSRPLVPAKAGTQVIFRHVGTLCLISAGAETTGN